MEMDFPHLDSMPGALRMRRDFRALISRAISRQGKSPTARAMHSMSRVQADVASGDAGIGMDAIEARIHYFSAALHPVNAETAPYGAFFPQVQAVFSQNRNYDQAVYHDGLANSKVDDLSMDLSEASKTPPGQNQ